MAGKSTSADPLKRTLEVRTSRRTELKDVTAEIAKAVRDSGCAKGFCHLYVPHTTAGVLINEGYDPDVARDMEAAFDRLIPSKGDYKHSEGNSDSHIKTALVGTSETVWIEDGRLALGQWQKIFVAEFDGAMFPGIANKNCSRPRGLKIAPMKLGIYIQVPFCQTKCTYCNFHTGVVSRDRYQPYAEAVCREIAECTLSDVATHSASVDSVYFGGGTPSLLDPSALGKMIATLRRHYRVESAETTLEADPETITADKAVAWVGAGFNRISLGSQSFDDRELRAAGRMHRRADIFRAVELLRRAGLCNISLDLIAGLAHQSRETWDESVSELLRVRPEHVSIYMLEIDEGSRLGKEALAGGSRYSAGAIPEEDAMAEFYESACARLAQAGYEHYEISNWGLPGYDSRHNLKYWMRAPYIGFGAGAHSFDGQKRWANIHDSARYVMCIEQGISTREQIEDVTPEQAFEEEFFLGLRKLDGIDLARIERESGTGLQGRMAELRKRITGMAAQGLVEFDGTRLRLAPDRLTVSNEVLVELLG